MAPEKILFKYAMSTVPLGFWENGELAFWIRIRNLNSMEDNTVILGKFENSFVFQVRGIVIGVRALLGTVKSCRRL